MPLPIQATHLSVRGLPRDVRVGQSLHQSGCGADECLRAQKGSGFRLGRHHVQHGQFPDNRPQSIWANLRVRPSGCLVCRSPSQKQRWQPQLIRLLVENGVLRCVCLRHPYRRDNAAPNVPHRASHLPNLRSWRVSHNRRSPIALCAHQRNPEFDGAGHLWRQRQGGCLGDQTRARICWVRGHQTAFR